MTGFAVILLIVGIVLLMLGLFVEAVKFLLWVGVFLLGLLLGRLRSQVGNLASSGVLGLELMLKALVVLVVLVAIAASRPDLALATILVFALAYTAERALALAAYFGAGAAP